MPGPKKASREGPRLNISSLLNTKESDLIFVVPGASVADAAKELNKKRVGAVLVRSVEGRTVGILSERDIVAAISEQGEVALSLTVEDLMSRNVVTCRPSDSASHLARIMARQHIRHVPVVECDELVGMVSVRDLLSVFLDADGEDDGAYRSGRPH